jgi:hypothetical protein
MVVCADARKKRHQGSPAATNLTERVAAALFTKDGENLKSGVLTASRWGSLAPETSAGRRTPILCGGRCRGAARRAGDGSRVGMSFLFF